MVSGFEQPILLYQFVILQEGETGSSVLDKVRFNQSCVPKTCPKLTAPVNGLLLTTAKTFHYPLVVEFQCRFAYQVSLKN